MIVVQRSSIFLPGFHPSCIFAETDGLQALTYDPDSTRGSLVVDSEEVNKVWAALSIYGTHLGHRVAVHLYKVQSTSSSKHVRLQLTEVEA